MSEGPTFSQEYVETLKTESARRRMAIEEMEKEIERLNLALSSSQEALAEIIHECAEANEMIAKHEGVAVENLGDHLDQKAEIERLKEGKANVAGLYHSAERENEALREAVRLAWQTPERISWTQSEPLNGEVTLTTVCIFRAYVEKHNLLPK